MSDSSMIDRTLIKAGNSQKSNSDEINLLEYLYVIVKNKWWIFAALVIGGVGGRIAAKYKGPTWVAEVMISPKDAESQKTPNLSSFGAFGGLVANQLNIGGNASIDKIALLLNSRDFNARMIEKYKLLPVIYKYKWPSSYALYWDSTLNDWNESFKMPQLLGLGGFLKNSFLKETVKDKRMTITVTSRDSAMSFLLAASYVKFLDEDIRTSVQRDAKENVEYLEQQMISIGDPLLREKIQSLIADEIEKMMVVSKEAFKIVDPLYLQQEFKEKMLYPVVFGLGLMCLTTALVLFFHILTTAPKSEEDNELIRKIRCELFSVKNKSMAKK